DVQLAFHYEDFRQGWKAGIALSRQMDLYRQQYCGCIYSEKERYSTKGGDIVIVHRRAR
ncbi:MAG: epoxyqueuosine reductase QueH, partial [Deltaproteobacteria bacterium]|nr:epoxyqueuosine reductase QueH [Deltaproteobacteria bacterium]